MNPKKWMSPILTLAIALSIATPSRVYAQSNNRSGYSKPEISPEERERRRQQSERDKARNREQQRNNGGYSSGGSSGGISDAEAQRRREQSERDKARYREQQRNNNPYGGNNTYNQQPSNQPNYKYNSKEEREAAKRERKRLRDAGYSTTTTDVIHKRDGSTTTVTNTTNPYGKTTTDVNKYDRYGNRTTNKEITHRYIPGTHTADVKKKVTTFTSDGYVRKVTTERSTSFRNSSQYNTVYSRQTTYQNYRTQYRTVYSHNLYRQYGFYGGYYYDFRPVLTIDTYFGNPLVYWLYNADYDDRYYSRYWGESYTRFSAFRYSGVFYPTVDLIDLVQEVAGMPWYQTQNFRTSMSLLVERINARAPGRLGYNDLVITHSEVLSENAVVVEGYANTTRAFAFKALLDLNSPYNSIVFIPTTYSPTMSDIADLVEMNNRIRYERDYGDRY